MKTIGIIPARGGSVRVKNKNIKSLRGEPLIVYTIRQALSSGVIDDVIVSTDDSEIALISGLEGATIYSRPIELRGDCDSELVAQQVLTEYERINNSEVVNIVVLLQCTSPLRKPETITNCVHLLDSNWFSCDSVLTISNIQSHRPEWMGSMLNNWFVPYTNTWTHEKERYMRLVSSMDLPKLYSQNGCVYVCKRDLLFFQGLVIGNRCKAIEIDEIEAFDLDVELDFEIAEKLMEKYR
jgi:CMP-N,N'-diacetyllegionaminic acid synthase